MRIPVSWLKEHLDFTMNGEALADILTLSGTKIEGVEQTADGEVLVAEITSNRADCLCVRGMAVELAAVLGRKIKKVPAFKVPAAKTKNLLSIRIKILDRKICPGYTVRVFDSVAVGPSPAGLVAKLRMMNQDSVSNVVDITNFCLYEIGQPTHAFDYDKIRGKKIMVRRAGKGEKFVGINGVEYELDESIPVIADEDRAIAIAGVMGGKETEITPQTRRVALESARFDPVAVRNAARKLKIATASSYRFERGIDPAKVKRAQDRVAELLIRWAKAKPASDLRVDGTLEPKNPRTITVDFNRAGKMLRLPIDARRGVKRLASLGIRGRVVSESIARFTGEPSRPDLAIEEDFVEELARLEGYDKIPTTLPPAQFAFESGVDSSQYKLHRALRENLVAQGFWEAMTYSLVSEDLLRRCGMGSVATTHVKNALTLEQALLKPSGLPGLLTALSFNARRKEKDLKLFEISRHFSPEGEKTNMSLAASGVWQRDWEGQAEASFAKIKGAVENLIIRSGRKTEAFRWEESSGDGSFERKLFLVEASGLLGFVAEVRSAVLAQMDLTDPVYFAEINLDALLALPKKEHAYREVPKMPAVRRDLAILIHQKYQLNEIEQTIRRAAGPYLTSIALFDEYKGKGIPDSIRSLAFSLQFQKADDTFRDEEIQGLHQTVIAALQSKFGATLR